MNSQIHNAVGVLQSGHWGLEAFLQQTDDVSKGVNEFAAGGQFFLRAGGGNARLNDQISPAVRIGRPSGQIHVEYPQNVI